MNNASDSPTWFSPSRSATGAWGWGLRLGGLGETLTLTACALWLDPPHLAPRIESRNEFSIYNAQTPKCIFKTLRHSCCGPMDGLSARYSCTQTNAHGPRDRCTDASKFD